jgi:hypothetical protein
MSQRLSTLYLSQEANRRVTTLGPVANLERLGALADPTAELDRDERRRCAKQALVRFEGYIQLSPTGCHLWTGSVTAEGYGQFFLNGRLHLARRVAYELWVGPIRPNERVYSSCAAKACVNSCHLEACPVAMPTLPDNRFTRAWIGTEAGAWFLGLWTADGYLSRDANMSLALKDHDAVRLAAVALGLNADRVGLHRRLGQARIRVGVKWFLPRLAAIGVAPGPKTGRFPLAWSTTATSGVESLTETAGYAQSGEWSGSSPPVRSCATSSCGSSARPSAARQPSPCAVKERSIS